MSTLGSVAKRHFLIYFAYLILGRLIAFSPDGFITGATFSAVCIVIHFLYLIIVGIQNFSKERPLAKNQFLIALTIALIGFPVCFGTFMVGESFNMH